MDFQQNLDSTSSDAGENSYSEIFLKYNDLQDFPLFQSEKDLEEDISCCFLPSDFSGVGDTSGENTVDNLETLTEHFNFEELANQNEEICDLNLQEIYDFIINGENDFGREESKTEDNKFDKTEKLNIPETSKLGIRCSSCETVIKNRRDFIAHYKTCCDKKLEFACSICDRSFTNYLSFRSHCYRHSSDKYKCSFCGKGFSIKSKLESHTTALHSSERPHVCSVCGKGYATTSSLRLHEKTHIAVYTYMCHTCGRLLFSKQGVARHMKEHEGASFMCEECGKQFLYRSELKQHRALAHETHRPNRCHHCNKTFVDGVHLRRHMSVHNEERAFKCTECGKAFKTEGVLRGHSMLHLPVKPYLCSHCGKGFVKMSKLKEHANIHTGVRPFLCQHCGRSFTNTANLCKHTRRMHS